LPAVPGVGRRTRGRASVMKNSTLRAGTHPLKAASRSVRAFAWGRIEQDFFFPILTMPVENQRFDPYSRTKPRGLVAGRRARAIFGPCSKSAVHQSAELCDVPGPHEVLQIIFRDRHDPHIATASFHTGHDRAIAAPAVASQSINAAASGCDFQPPRHVPQPDKRSVPVDWPSHAVSAPVVNQPRGDFGERHNSRRFWIMSRVDFRWD